MSVLSTLSAFQSPLLLVATVFGPSVFSFLTRQTNPNIPRPARPPLPLFLKALLVLHTAYHLFSLFYPPYDIFTTHSLPLLTSNTSLRSAILGRQQSLHSSFHPSRIDELHPLLELLLTRLQNLDTRYLYVRFGHRPLLTCVWCTDINDFLLASLPGILGPYLVETVVLGVMGWDWVGGVEGGRRAEKWRVGFSWALGWMVVGEVGVRYLWDVRAVEGDCLHLSSTIHTVRSIALLLLPIIYLLLPIPTPSPPFTSLFPALSNTQSTIRLTSLSRSAISHNPRLRNTWLQSGEAEARAAQAGREDKAVVEMTREVGINEEDMRENARRWIDQGWRGMVRMEADQSGT